MSISRDPSKAPSLDAPTFDAADRLGFRIVNVLVDSADESNAPLAFLVATPGIPSVGEFIELPGGSACRVTSVVWRTTKHENGAFLLVPNVGAKLLSPPNEKSPA
jgi:hypothetical protein